MGIEFCPVDSDECAGGLVPQECHGQSEKHKPSTPIREHEVCRKSLDWCHHLFVSVSRQQMEKVGEVGEMDGGQGRDGGHKEGVLHEVGAAEEAESEAEQATNEEEDDDENELDDKADEKGDGGEDGGNDEGDQDDNSREGNRGNWEDGDRHRGNMPEFLFRVSGERKIPACTMNDTEDGARDQQKQDVPVRGILMPWDVKCRDMSGSSREGSTRDNITDGRNEGNPEHHDRRKESRNNQKRDFQNNESR